MPTISGVIAYDPTNLYSYPNAVPAGRIASGVPIALQDISTGVGLVVLTDAAGSFSFDTVPAGNYQLVEAWGTTGGVTSPGDFSTATVISAPTPQDPPLSEAPSPPAAATRLSSLTGNTITLTMASSNLTGQNFVDSPITETPISYIEASLVGGNLIVDAQDGQWGTLPAGAPNAIIVAAAPYPANVPSEVFVSVTPGGGQYTVSNMFYNAALTAWYSISNHTTFDETSRMMIINANGGVANEYFFKTTVNVTPNTYYVGSAWIANLVNVTGLILPQVGVIIKTTGGTTIFNSPTPQLVFSNPPNWVEIGGVFNPGNNSTVDIFYQSIAAGSGGNDFTADDFSVYELQINNFITSNKIVSKPIAIVGEILTYTIALNNSGTTTALAVSFQDTIPAGTSFFPGSVFINGINQAAFNPTTGFSAGNIGIGSNTIISFKVNVVSVPSTGQAINNSSSVYSFAPVLGGVTIPVSTFSNETQTDIINSSISKSVSNNYSDLDQDITYTIVYNNLSFITATNLIFIDTTPSGAAFASGSLTVNGASQPGDPNPPGASIPNVPPNSTVTITYNVITPSTLSFSPLKNSGQIGAIFTTTLGTAIAMTVNSNITTTTLASAIISSNKAVNKVFGNIGDTLTYTVTFNNTGNVTASNIIFIDTIPSNTTLVPGSLKQDGAVVTGSSNPPGVTLPNSITPNGVSLVTFQVTVDTIPNPNPIPNNAAASYSYIIDSTTTPNVTGTNATNTNTVNTQINNANLSNISKLVDKAFATCGDILTYTILVPNSGNATAINISIVDTIPNGAIFITNSVVVNGLTVNGVSPVTGVNIGNIAALSTSTMTFQVRVTC